MQSGHLHQRTFRPGAGGRGGIHDDFSKWKEDLFFFFLPEPLPGMEGGSFTQNNTFEGRGLQIKISILMLL